MSVHMKEYRPIGLLRKIGILLIVVSMIAAVVTYFIARQHTSFAVGMIFAVVYLVIAAYFAPMMKIWRPLNRNTDSLRVSDSYGVSYVVFGIIGVTVLGMIFYPMLHQVFGVVPQVFVAGGYVIIGLVYLMLIPYFLKWESSKKAAMVLT